MTGHHLARHRSRFRRATVALARGVRARSSLILCYHGVEATSRSRDPGFLCVPPLVFRDQVDLLISAGFELVTVAELARRADRGAPPPGLAALSFDDGMENNHRELLPILLEKEVPATVYVATGLIGRANPFMGRGSNARMMNEAELRDLVRAGIELGAHTVGHPDLSQLDYDTCLREIDESRRELERISGTAVTTFAYPFCKYGHAARDAARDAGLAMAVTCHGRGGWGDPWATRRTMITGKDGPLSFLAKLTGSYEPVFTSRPGRTIRVVSRPLRTAVRAARERRVPG